MQKALMIKEKLGEITHEIRPIPKIPEAGELIIEIRATAINGLDWKIPKLGIVVEEYPAVLGYDVAGEVMTVGEDVSKFDIGDRVFGSGLPHPDYGGYQSYCILKADFAAKVPEKLTYEQASTFPLAFFGAYKALYNNLPNGMGLTPLIPSGRDKYTNKPILIIGGGSYVGSFGIQLAKLSGFSPIITTTSLKHSSRLKELGATHIIDRNTSTTSLRDQIISILVSTNIPSPSAASEGAGVLEYIFDAISSPSTQPLALELLIPGGTLGLNRLPHIPIDQGKTVGVATGFPDAPENRECVKAAYDEFTKWIEEGLFKPSEVKIVPGGLNAVADYLKKMENDEISGVKLVINPSEAT